MIYQGGSTAVDPSYGNQCKAVRGVSENEQRSTRDPSPSFYPPHFMRRASGVT
jgi:hypothetical protein